MNFDINKIELEDARKMLIYECNLRKSEIIQKLYTLIQEKKMEDSELIENYVQYQTLKYFNYDTTIENLKNYRQIAYKFGQDVEDYAFYLKYNIMKEPLINGSQIDTKDLTVLTLNKDPVNFNSFFQRTECASTSFVNNNDKPILIFSGSLT